MELHPTPKQYLFLKRLQGKNEPALLKDLKPATPVAERTQLVREGLVEEGKRKRSAIFSLTEKGRSWITAHPQPPMSPFPSVAQRVFLYRLAFMHSGGSSTGMASSLKAAERKILEDHKWTRSQKQGRATEFELTDSGWEWVESHLADPMAGQSPVVALGDVLACVDGYLRTNNLRLADLIRARKPAHRTDASERSGSETNEIRESESAGNIKSAIRDACLKLAEGQVKRRVRLAELRKALGGWSREQVDKALFELAVSEPAYLVLEAIDDPQDIRQEDRESVFRTPSGEIRNIVYWIQS